MPRVIFTYKTAAVAEMVRGFATSDQNLLSERANPPPPCTAAPWRLAHQAPTLLRESSGSRAAALAGGRSRRPARGRLPDELLRCGQHQPAGRALPHHHHEGPPGARHRHDPRHALRRGRHRPAHAAATRSVPRPGLPGYLPNRVWPRRQAVHQVRTGPDVRQQRLAATHGGDCPGQRPLASRGGHSMPNSCGVASRQRIGRWPRHLADQDNTLCSGAERFGQQTSTRNGRSDRAPGPPGGQRPLA